MDHAGPQPRGHRLERMVLLVGAHHGREEKRVEHGLSEADASPSFLQLEEAQVERHVVADQHRPLREPREQRQHLLDRGLALEHLGRNAVDPRGGRVNRASRVHEPVESLLPQ